MTAICWLCTEPIEEGPRITTAFGWLNGPDGWAHQEPAHVECHTVWREVFDGPWTFSPVARTVTA